MQDEGTEERAFSLRQLEKLETRLDRRVRVGKYTAVVFPLCMGLAIATLRDEYHFSGTAVFGFFMLSIAIGTLIAEANSFVARDLLVMHAALRDLYRNRPGR